MLWGPPLFFPFSICQAPNLCSWFFNGVITQTFWREQKCPPIQRNQTKCRQKKMGTGLDHYRLVQNGAFIKWRKIKWRTSSMAHLVFASFFWGGDANTSVAGWACLTSIWKDFQLRIFAVWKGLLAQSPVRDARFLEIFLGKVVGW